MAQLMLITHFTTRIPNGKNPIRIVLAKSGNVDFTKQLFQDSSSEVWIYTENQTLESPNRNIKVICIDKCYLKDILKDIYKRGIGSLLIEAGPRITSNFFKLILLINLLFITPRK